MSEGLVETVAAAMYWRTHDGPFDPAGETELIYLDDARAAIEAAGVERLTTELAQWVRQAEDNSGEAQRAALEIERLQHELAQERGAFARHEQTLRDNGIRSHADAVVQVTELRAILERYVAAYPAFRIKPVGAPGSPARIEQENLMALEEAAKAALEGGRS